MPRTKAILFCGSGFAKDRPDISVDIGVGSHIGTFHPGNCRLLDPDNLIKSLKAGHTAIL